MEKTFDTGLGEVVLRHAMIDTNGTDLVDGVEVVLEGDTIGNHEYIDDLSGLTISEVEDIVVDLL